MRALPDVNELLAKQMAEPVGSTHREAVEHLDAEMKRWGKIIKSAGVTFE